MHVKGVSDAIPPLSRSPVYGSHGMTYPRLWALPQRTAWPYIPVDSNTCFAHYACDWRCVVFETTLEAMEFIRLNPGEEIRYNELWAEASAGEDRVSGKEAVAVLSRAEHVSKSQLRLVWDIADHRKEGELDHDQFRVALRLLALAQRGAEISIKGLRNFVGIQLIPNVRPAPKPAPVPASPADTNGPAAADGDAGAGQPAAPRFSWAVPADVIAQYDQFFTGLDAAGSGFVVGRVGASFFAKSGLARPVLKHVWQLADITRDGKLSKEEFRQAMHLVRALQTRLVQVGDLPQSLDPTGPLWVRSEQEFAEMQARAAPVVAHTPPSHPSAVHAMGMATQPSAPPQTGEAGSFDLLGDFGDPASAGPMPTATSPHPEGGRSPVVALGSVPTSSPPPPPPSAPRGTESQAHSDYGGSTGTPRRGAPEDADAGRIQRELEEMRNQLERLKAEKEDAQRMSTRQTSDMEQMRAAFEDMMSAKRKAEDEAAAAKAEAERLRNVEQSTVTSTGQAFGKPLPEQIPHMPMPEQSSLPAQATRKPRPTAAESIFDNVSPAAPAVPSAPAGRNPQGTAGDVPPTVSTGLSRGASASAQAGAPAAPEMAQSANASAQSNGGVSKPPRRRLLSADSLSESDDDDDFWGASGVGPKPSLGTNAAASGSAAQGGSSAQTNSGFGNDLDEWAF